MAEGFPSAICEAMLCGCIPIGSNVAAIPYIIGDTGFVLHKKDTDKLVELCHTALNADVRTLSRRARARVEEICAPGSRAQKLTTLAEKLVDDNKLLTSKA
jgi:glycosyltransferase involved in cell wall biosynthesis